MAPRLLLAAALFAAGCTCVTDSDCPLDEMCTDGRCVGRPSGGDVTPPTATLSAPGAGAAVSGTVTLTASASDDVGVSAVDFAVDGATVASATGAPYSVTWSSGSVWNGPHIITAIAHDAAGNAGTSAGVSVSVANYPGAAVSVHTSMGLPDAATADPSNTDHFLSVKHQYALSYSGTRRTPNWVSWELNTTWMGPVARQNDFRPDDTFPAGFPQAQLADYLSSGWDRGHMCPSEDRTATLIDNENTFYLTNMVPQADNVNGGPWAQLEAYARSLATSGKEIFEVAGGIYAGTPKTIGADAVAVPSSTFKVIVVLDTPGQTAANVTTSTRVISVIMPNDNASVAKSADWHGFRVKAADIESQTGLRLLSDVAEPVRATLENRVDTAP
ncbi:MAG: DNA/RNA non-specific endonuclease [Myxococcales bacterium]|nr:DNA/RNA non-specific endonuclease [Myxococcales bacterium]